MNRSKLQLIAVSLLIVLIAGCVTMPPEILRLPPDSVQKRQFQSRQYQTTDEEQVISSSASVLQDLGFNITETEGKLGLVVASKNRQAVDSGQVAFATTATLLAALSGSYSNYYQRIDKEQLLRVSVVTRLNENGDKLVVRATFQRVVWNMGGQVSRVETLDDANLYQGFFERLSKSVFLEEQRI